MLYVITMIYLGLVYVRPTELIPGWEEVPVVAMASAAAAPLLGWALFEGRGRLMQLPQDRLLWVLWGAIVVSNLVMGYAAGAILGVTAFAQVVYQYLLIRTSVRTIGQLRGAVFCLTAFMLFHAISGIVQLETGVGFGGVEPLITENEEIRIRSVGIFNDPNDLALSMVVVIPFLIVTMINPAVSWALRGLALCTLVPMLYAYYFTNSRGGVLGLAAALAVIGWRRYGKRLGPVLIIAGLAGIVALGPSRLSEMDAEEDSAQGRIQAWAAGLEMLKVNPVTGVGYGQFTEYHALVAHNSFVQIVAELGMVGSVAFNGIVLWYFLSLRRIAALPKVSLPPLRAWQTGFTAMGAAFFVSVLFLSRQYNPVFYTVIALGACYVSLVIDGEGDVIVVSQRDRIRLLTVTVGMVIALIVIVRLFAVWGG